MGEHHLGRKNRLPACVVAVLALISVSGCGAQDLLSDSDTEVISQLTSIAPATSEIEGDVTDVECWLPSENMLDEEMFRVLCRVHYDQAGEPRYRDMICIGETNQDPVTDYCYRWAYYTDMPEFEDEPGHSVN